MSQIICRHLFVFILFLSFYSSISLAAEPMRDRTGLFEKRHYQSMTGFTEMDYYLMTPRHYDPKKKYPLVVTLHGASGHSWGAYILAGPDMQRDYPAFVLVPHPTKISSWEVEAYKDFKPNPTDHVARIINSLTKEFSIDKDRIYLTGYSMGGFGTFGMVAQYPNLFAAAAPLCGGGDVSEAGKMINTPIWAFHGNLDQNIPVERSRKMVRAIKAAGGKTIYYSEFPVQHNVWDTVYALPKFWQWLFSQKRTES